MPEKFKRTIPANSHFELSKTNREIKFKRGDIEFVRVKMKPGMTVDQADLPGNAQIPAASPGFKLGRLIMNLKATIPEGETLEMYIKIDPYDADFAGGRNKIKLAYLVEDEWSVIDGVNWDNPEYALIVSSNWPSDPPIAAGK